jgi:hypothetical protein
MQYTTQQLQGGPKYSHKTRIGNWNEDHELNVIKQTDFDAKKTAKALPFDQTLGRYQEASKKVPMTHSADGLLRSGDSMMVQNRATCGFLVMDLGEKQLGV